MNHGSELWYHGLQRSEAVARICDNLNSLGWKPDKILAHSGWGETLSIPVIWPDVPQIIWPELWLRPLHGGFGLDPELPPVELSHFLEHTGRNALTRVALAHAKCWILPTQHQAESFPSEFLDNRLHVIHEGIDTHLARPNKTVSFSIRGKNFDRNSLVLTFINRNLERLRGFDVFMRSLPPLFQTFLICMLWSLAIVKKDMVHHTHLDVRFGKLCLKN